VGGDGERHSICFCFFFDCEKNDYTHTYTCMTNVIMKIMAGVVVVVVVVCGRGRVAVEHKIDTTLGPRKGRRKKKRYTTLLTI
jgi:hypothetical protein